MAQELTARGGIGVRSGCHCAHMLVKRLLHIPWLLEQFQGVILTLFKRLSLPGLTRVSLGIENSAEEIDTLLQVVRNIAMQPQVGASEDTQRQMNDFANAMVQRVYASARETTATVPIT